MRRSTPEPRRSSRGFTLIELIVGITILGIVLAIGVPSFGSVIRKNRLASQVNEYSVALNMARSEAYKRGLPVIVCAANATLDGCSGSTNWATGWIVFVDADSNNGFTSGELILQKTSPPSGGFTYTTIQSQVSFRPLGASALSVDIYKDGCTGPEKRRISVISTGRIKMDKISC
jgi:type IV fimbrial biogenesis protein FimT